MKSQKGVTLISVVIYVLVATILIASMAMLSTFFFSNVSEIKTMQQYAPEFNKFSMFFIEDVKNNTTAYINESDKTILVGTTLTFTDGTVYTYNESEKSVYRNETRIAEKVDSFKFTLSEYKVSNTTKQIVNVQMSVNGEKNAENGIEYVLKYW